MAIEKLKTLSLDTEKGVCIINGENVSGNVTKLSVEYDSGEWALDVTLNRMYTSGIQKIKKRKYIYKNDSVAYHDKVSGGSWASNVLETSYTDIQTGDVIREIYGPNGQYKRVVLRDLKTVKTCELVDELKARTGVTLKYAEPHTYKNFSVNGPAVVLIITD